MPYKIVFLLNRSRKIQFYHIMFFEAKHGKDFDKNSLRRTVLASQKDLI